MSKHKIHLASGDECSSTGPITISRDRFKCLYNIKCAAAKHNETRLTEALKRLSKIEARDFVHGLEQEPKTIPPV